MREEFDLKKAQEAREKAEEKAKKGRGHDQAFVSINLNDDDPDIPLEVL